MFDSDMGYFSREFHTVGIDLPGNGNSEPFKTPPANYWEETAKAVLAVCKKLNFFRANIVGAGGGGIVALHMAIMNPKVATCVIADSIFGDVFIQNDLIRMVQHRKKIAEEDDSYWLYMHGENWAEMLKNDNQMHLDFLKGQKGNFFRGKLKEIKSPVLLTGALENKIIPQIELRMGRVARQIPDCKLVLFPGGGHPLCTTENSNFRKLITTFIHERGVVGKG